MCRHATYLLCWCRVCIADSAFASYKLAVALLMRNVYLIGNVKTAHSGFPKAKLQSMANERDKTATATTTVCLPGSSTEHTILATSDMDKQPMSCICTAGTSRGPVIIQRRVRTIHKNGRAKVSGKIFKTLQAPAYYRKNFNAVDKHNAKRQGGHCLEDVWKTHRWVLRDFQALYGVSLVNTLLAIRHFKAQPDLRQWKFMQRLCEQLLQNAVALGRRSKRQKVSTEVRHVLSSTKQIFAKQVQRTCMVCKKKQTQWFCECGRKPTPNFNPGQKCSIERGVFFCCSTAQSPTCLPTHIAEWVPPEHP